MSALLKSAAHILILIMLFVSVPSCGPELVQELPGEKPAFADQQGYNLLLDGDSRTDGWNCREEKPYLDYLELGKAVRVQKISYGGATSWELNNRSTDVYEEYFDPERHNVVVVWIGANDLVVHNQKPDVVFNNLVKYCSERSRQGWDVILCTEISLAGSLGLRKFDQDRLKLNDSLRSQYRNLASGLADLAAIAELGSVKAWQDETYFCDGVHLTNHGSFLVAQAVQQAFNEYRLFKGRGLGSQDAESYLSDQ